MIKTEYLDSIRKKAAAIARDVMDKVIILPLTGKDEDVEKAGIIREKAIREFVDVQSRSLAADLTLTGESILTADIIARAVNRSQTQKFGTSAEYWIGLRRKTWRAFDDVDEASRYALTVHQFSADGFRRLGHCCEGAITVNRFDYQKREDVTEDVNAAGIDEYVDRLIAEAEANHEDEVIVEAIGF